MKKLIFIPLEKIHSVRKYSSLTGFILGAVMLITTAGLSLSYGTEVAILPATQNATIDSLIKVDVAVNNVVDLIAVQFTVAYDPAVLQAVGIAEGPFLKGPDGFDTTLFIPGSRKTPGLIENTAITRSIFGQGPLSGSGVLASVTFKVIGYAASPGSEVRIPAITLKRPDLSVIPVDSNSSGFVVNEPIVLIPGDFDQDGDVDGSDLAVFSRAFGSIKGDANYNPTADFDSDGDVDGSDLRVFSANFGRVG